MAKVVLENVFKSFPPRGRSDGQKEAQATNVLRNISLEIEDGEFMVLVGPSGCGKSTLLRIISGLETLTAGNLWVGDHKVNDLPPKARDLAMVFQSYALYPHLSVYDNLAFGLRRQNEASGNSLGAQLQNIGGQFLRGLTRPLPKTLRYSPSTEQAIVKQVQEVAELLQIDTLLQRRPKELSGGQKQRVALGRAIARNPQVFLMDEPLSNLDAKLRAETRAQIVKLQRQLGTTTIYVTHDQTEAMTMGDRIAVLNLGEIQQIAPPLELYRRPANRFVAEFIGSPPMNFLPVTLGSELRLMHSQFKVTLPSTWTDILSSSQERALLLGVRPEDFQLNTLATGDFFLQVELVEALGNDTFVFGKIEGTKEQLQLRLNPNETVHIGERLALNIDLNKVHLFDASTGVALH
ncbi:MAG: ATP-binding cassette domain-containing protein [Cyanobacteria bacterium P01_H01_bin.15]